jgi:hypothetical protein
MGKSSIRNICSDVLNKLDKMTELSSSFGFSEQLHFFRERIDEKEFRICVVGAFSSGKSTFINALIGQDILNHALTETTATITRIVNTPQSDPRYHTGFVKKRDGSTQTLHSIDDLRDYTTTSSEKYHVVDDIELVEIYMPLMDASRPMVIVDTPGLNGTADGHRSRTIELIQKSHACLYLLQRGGLTDEDVKFLRYLKGIQKNYIFIQNFLDDIRENENPEGKIDEQKRILADRVFEPKDHVDYYVCGISAWLALVGRDTSIPTVYEDDTEILTDERRSELYARSHLEEFLGILEERFGEQRLDLIQYGDTALAMSEWLAGLSSLVANKEQTARELGMISSDARAAKKMENARNKILANKEKQKEQLRVLAKSETEIIQKSRMKQLEDDLEDVISNTEKQVSAIHTLEEMDRLIESTTESMQTVLLSITSTHFERLTQSMHNLRQTLLRRMQEYSGVEDVPDLNEIALSIHENETISDFRLETEIERLEEEEKKLDKQFNDQSMKSQKLKRQSIESAADVRTMQSALDNAIRNKENAIRGLRGRPEKVTRYRTVTYEEYHGGLGIIDALFGPKTKQKQQEYTDDSAGQKWDRERAEIENRYSEQFAKLRRDLEAAQRREIRLKGESKDVDDELTRLSKKKRSIETRIKEQKKTLEAELIHAKKELLAKRKKALLSQLRFYLFDGENSIIYQIKGTTAKITDECSTILGSDAARAYESIIASRLAGIEEAISQRTPELLREADALADARSSIESFSSLLLDAVKGQ